MTNKTRLKRLRLLLRMLHVMPQMTEALGSTYRQTTWFDDDMKPRCIGGHMCHLKEFADMGLTGSCSPWFGFIYYHDEQGFRALSDLLGITCIESRDLFEYRGGAYVGMRYIPVAIRKVERLIEKYENHG